MSDTEDLEHDTAEVKKVTLQGKKKKTPAVKKKVMPMSEEADEAPAQSPAAKKTITKKKGKTPRRQNNITDDTELTGAPKNKKVASSDGEDGAEEVVEKAPVKAKVTTKKPATPTGEKRNNPAAGGVKTIAKKNISNDTGTTAPISDGTAQQLLSVDSHMTAVLKKRGVVLKKLLHQGKYSTIYKAEMTTTTVAVTTAPNTSINVSNTPNNKTNIIAVRILFLDRIKRDAVRQRQKFIPRELSTLCSVHHEGLVTVHEVVRSGARVAILMELIRDGTLTDYLSENGPMTEPAAAVWFIEVTRALEYLHEECKLAHRNIKTVLLFAYIALSTNILKPTLLSRVFKDNILLNSGRVKLSMAAFPLDAWDYDEGKAVLSKTMCGTHQYKSPQLARNLPYDPYAADCKFEK